MAGGRPALEFSIEQESLRRLAKTLRKLEDGKALRKQLIAEIKATLEPLRDEVRESILSMEGGGLPHDGEPLRQAIANQTVVEVRTGGRATGAAIKVKRRGMPRGFNNAGKWTNRNKWRHPVFKRVTSTGLEVDVWVDQVGKPRWFDDTIRRQRSTFRKRVAKAMNEFARKAARGGS